MPRMDWEYDMLFNQIDDTRRALNKMQWRNIEIQFKNKVWNRNYRELSYQDPYYDESPVALEEEMVEQIEFEKDMSKKSILKELKFVWKSNDISLLSSLSTPLNSALIKSFELNNIIFVSSILKSDKGISLQDLLSCKNKLDWKIIEFYFIWKNNNLYKIQANFLEQSYLIENINNFLIIKDVLNKDKIAYSDETYSDISGEEEWFEKLIETLKENWFVSTNDFYKESLIFFRTFQLQKLWKGSELVEQIQSTNTYKTFDFQIKDIDKSENLTLNERFTKVLEKTKSDIINFDTIKEHYMKNLVNPIFVRNLEYFGELKSEFEPKYKEPVSDTEPLLGTLIFESFKSVFWFSNKEVDAQKENILSEFWSIIRDLADNLSSVKIELYYYFLLKNIFDEFQLEYFNNISTKDLISKNLNDYFKEMQSTINWFYGNNVWTENHISQNIKETQDILFINEIEKELNIQIATSDSLYKEHEKDRILLDELFNIDFRKLGLEKKELKSHYDSLKKFKANFFKDNDYKILFKFVSEINKEEVENKLKELKKDIEIYTQESSKLKTETPVIKILKEKLISKEKELQINQLKKFLLTGLMNWEEQLYFVEESKITELDSYRSELLTKINEMQEIIAKANLFATNSSFAGQLELLENQKDIASYKVPWKKQKQYDSKFRI